MENIIQIIIDNLTNVGIGVGIFVLAYLANMCLGSYYNINILGQSFDWHKILLSAVKIICVGFGIVLLTLAITLVLPFADNNGLTIPDEYSEVIRVIVILATCLSAALKYIIEAVTKLRNILNNNAQEN